MLRLAALFLVVAAACGSPKPAAAPTPPPAAVAAEPAVSRVVSKDILAREPVANHTRVKHILIGWKELADNYGGNIDARAVNRSKAEAEQIVEGLLAQLKSGGDFDAIMKDKSEDLSSAITAQPIAVAPDASLVIEFKQLGMRLEVGEIGVCESQYGFHIMKRVE